MMKKFAVQKDEYYEENSNFVCDQLTLYESQNLQGYNNGGYAYKSLNNSRVSNRESTQICD